MTNIPPIFPYVAPLVTSFTLCVLFFYLYLAYRLRFLGIWTAAWALWTLRIGYTAFVGTTQYTAWGNFGPILSLAYTTLILLGAEEVGGQQVMKVWLPLAVFGLLFNEFFTSTEYGIAVIMLVIGSGWIWAGLLFKNSDKEIGRVRWIPVICLIGMGFHHWALPLYLQYPFFGPWSLNITLALQIGIAIGVLVVFNSQVRNRLNQAHVALEKSLTKVLSGFIPICSNCKSIRDEQKQWHRLEAYISERTDAQVTHGICPDCKKELYPELELT